MAQLIDLGKLRFEFRNDWNSGTQYEQNDVVRYGGNLYAYKNITATTGNLPTNTTYWALMLEGFDFQGEWDDEAAYNLGDVVTYGGKVYIANQDDEGTVPGTPVASGENAVWAQLVDGIQYEGVYSGVQQYQKGDVVTFGGATYIATQDTVGNDPSNTSYWDILVNGVDYLGTYNGATSYKINDIVTYGGSVYICTSSSTGNVPTNTSYWDLLVDGIQYEGDYNGSTAYQVGDVVKYGGIVYICTADSTGNAPTNTSFWSILIEGIAYKGAYSGATQYNKNDIVTYDGGTWIAVQETTNNAPADPSAFWDVVAQGTFPSFVGYEGAFLSNNGSAIIWTSDVSVDTLEATENLYVGQNARTQWENSGAKTYTVTNKSKTNDIVTLTTSTNHTLGAFQFIEVALDPADADFDGEYEIIDVTANTLTYEKVGSNVASTATGGTVDAVTGYTNSVAHFYIDADDYAQISFRNASDATNASTDFIAYASNGDDFAGYIDMGITSENFADPEFTITGPNDGYIFMDAPVGTAGAGNLVLATGARGTENKIVFAAGGLDSDSTQMEITPDLNVHIEIPTPSTDATTGALTVVGGVGIQGDMNIAGNVDIVGEITFGGSGTVVETQNLAVSDPTVFVGSNNLADNFDLGLIAEYAEDVVDQVTSVDNKALTNNVATLTTTTTHGYSIGDVVVITGVDATFNGTYVIRGVPTTTTFTYNKTAADVSSAAVSPTGTATVTHERRWGGVVRDVTDGRVKIFVGSTEKPTNTVDFANAGLSFADLQAGGAHFGSLTTPNITTTGGTLSLGGTVNIPGSINLTGGSMNLGGITVSGDATFSGNPTFSGSPIFSGTPSFTGGIRVQEMIEDVVDVAHSSNIITCDYSTGNIFYLTNTLSGAATVSLTNAPTTDGRIFTINVFVPQGSTGYLPGTVTINGSGTTLKWAAGLTPTPTSSSGKIDIFTYSIIRRSGAWTVLGSANLNF